jgi:hypothetical protein
MFVSMHTESLRLCSLLSEFVSLQDQVTELAERFDLI